MVLEDDIVRLRPLSLDDVDEWLAGEDDEQVRRIAGGVEVRDLGDGEVNLSYVVFPGFRQAGIASRAARLALRYAANEMGASVAVLKILEGNIACLGVARRLGAIVSGSVPSEAGGTVTFRLQLAADR